MLRLLWLTMLLALAACGKLPDRNPKGHGGLPLRELARVQDRNPDQRVVEFELTAAPSRYEFVQNHPTEVWTYNGQLPGPLIEANVGDEIIVHFRNRLPQATTVHWHGIRLTPEMDGSHLSQAPIPPGESFEYRFTVPDAGLYWYHPHHNGSMQLALGLYGALLVRGAGEPQFSRERVLVLSDALLDDRRETVRPQAVAQNPLTHSLGLEGNVALVNGQIEPQIEIAPGSRERWRIVNAATARYFNLAFPGQSFHLIGADGGLADRPYEMSELLLTPGERADIVVTAAFEEGEAELVALPYNKIISFVNFQPRPTEVLSRLRYRGPAVDTPPLPESLAEFPAAPAVAAQRFMQFTSVLEFPLDDYLATRHAPAVADGMEDGGSEFRINGRPFPHVPLITARLGTWERWRFNNHTWSDHPFHLHGFRFLIEDIDGVAPPYRVWKDTLNLPIVSGNSFVNVLVDFSGHPGGWVYHCHIVQHQEMGMMGELLVEP